MKIYYYITKNLIFSIIIISSILTTIIWLSQSLRYLSLIANGGLNLLDFIYLTSLIIPSLIGIILPISSFIGIIYWYNKLIVDSELVSLISFGLSRYNIFKPALSIGVLITIISYFCSLYLIPISYRQFKDQSNDYKMSYSSILLQEKIFNSFRGITIYLDEHLKNEILKGIFVHDNRNQDRPISIIANTGRIIKDINTTKLELFNGTRQEINKNNQLSILYFDHLIYELSFEKINKQTRVRDPQEHLFSDLINSIAEADSKTINKLKAELHHRLVWPIYSLLLVMMAYYAIYPIYFNRVYQNKRIITYSCLAIVIIISYFIMSGLITKFNQLVPILYFTPIIFISYYFLRIINY